MAWEHLKAAAVFARGHPFKDTTLHIEIIAGMVIVIAYFADRGAPYTDKRCIPFGQVEAAKINLLIAAMKEMNAGYEARCAIAGLEDVL